MKCFVPKYNFLILLFGWFWVAISFQCNSVTQGKHQDYTGQGDSITLWISKANKDTGSVLLKRHLLEKAYNNNILYSTDSLYLQHLRQISYQAFLLKDSVLFKSANKDLHGAAEKRRDTFVMAEAHWNDGAFYLDRIAYDSAYYHYREALELFERVPDSFYKAKMMYNMAFIQGRLHDYTGAEVILFRAISEFEALDRPRQLYQCYNLLGVVYEELNEYGKAIRYHQKALEYLKDIKDKSLKRLYLMDSQNNIGLIYQKQGDQSQALEYFDKVLDNPQLKQQDPELYARLLDNKAYSRLLKNDTVGLAELFTKSLIIRDSLKNISGVIVSKLHLAAYHRKYGDTLKAMESANKAYHLARDIQNNRDILSALSLLSDLDAAKRPDYQQEYIALSNTLQEQDRHTRNKFTRIQYETDRYIEKTQQLSSQRIWIITISTVLVITLLLVYFLNRQYARTKLLRLETEQQKANEQIYRLTLKQQSKLHEGRNQERLRISQELHDSVLGDLFGTRMSWGFLKLNGADKELEKHYKYLEELQRIEGKIREASHNLKDNLIPIHIDFIHLVEQLIKKRGKTGHFRARFYNDENIAWEKMDSIYKVNFYRIIEEALQNCIKHAKAETVEIRFEMHQDKISLTVSDDGIGTKTKRNKGIGLKNIKSRVRTLNGKFRIEFKRSIGTTLYVTVPAPSE